jgi:oligogalacturonide transport system permease protein
MSNEAIVNINKNRTEKSGMEKLKKNLWAYILLAVLSVVMVYPLVWLIFGSFKSNSELFASVSLLPQKFSFDSYVQGWQGIGYETYTRFFINTFEMVLPTVIFTVISSTLVAYGFARFNFPLKKVLFPLMISTMMLPQTVIIIPRYILFRKLGWLDTYLPFIVPAILACYPFFIFMMIQFFRGIPKELDEAATIDGCNPFTILIRVMLPLATPALFSAAIFQFIWTWNDFFNSLIFINSVDKYPISLALRIAIDSTGGTVAWNQVLAMSVLAILPPLLIFFFGQRYFVEGIATTGLKG